MGGLDPVARCQRLGAYGIMARYGALGICVSMAALMLPGCLRRDGIALDDAGCLRRSGLLIDHGCLSSCGALRRHGCLGGRGSLQLRGCLSFIGAPSLAWRLAFVKRNLVYPHLCWHVARA
jgi:hypothetical protein